MLYSTLSSHIACVCLYRHQQIKATMNYSRWLRNSSRKTALQTTLTFDLPVEEDRTKDFPYRDQQKIHIDINR